MDLQVIILAGGRGELLFPLAENKPKFMLPINNKPLVSYSLEAMERINHIFQRPILLITTESYSDKLNRYIQNKYMPYNQSNQFEVISVPEDNNNNIVDALRFIQDRIEGDVLIMSGDLILDFNVIDDFRQMFCLSEASCSLLLKEGASSQEEQEIYGITNDRVVQNINWLDGNENYKLKRLLLQNAPNLQIRNNLINMYCVLFKGSVLKSLIQCKQFGLQDCNSFKQEFLPFIIGSQFSRRLNNYLRQQNPEHRPLHINYMIVKDSFCQRINTIKNFLEVSQQCCTPLGSGPKKGKQVKPLPISLMHTRNNPENIIMPYYAAGRSSADIPPNYKQISSDSIIQEGFEIGEKSSIQRSILGKRVIVGKQVKISNCIIMNNVVIHDNVVLNGSIISSHVEIGAKAKVLNSQVVYGSRIEESAQLKSEIYLGQLKMDLPETVIQSIPDSIDFGFCPVNEETIRVFTMRNPLPKAPIRFHINNDSPFMVSPLSGSISPRGRQEISISYIPNEAVVIVATIVFHIENEGDKVLKLSAIGKYSYISLNKNTFSFGELLIGESETKNLLIKNQGHVPTTFHIIDDEDYSKALGTELVDNAFSFDVLTGTIPAGSSFLVKISFKPTVVHMLSSKNYIISTESGNTVRFTCLGSAIGVQVNLSSRVCNFGEVRLGNSTSRIVTLENSSSQIAHFKFFTESSNVFQFKKIEGTVGAKSTTRLMIYFHPKETMSYYKRVFGLVVNHSLLSLDLMGSCYDILHRPIPLSQRDIEIFRTHVLMGQLQKLVEKSPGMLTGTEEAYSISIEVPMDANNQIALHKEFMQNLKDKEPALSEEFIDFGFGIVGRNSEPRQFALTNRLPFEVYVLWLIPGQTQPEGEEQFPYSIKPVSTTIQAGKTESFSISFSPPQLASYYYKLLNCQIYIKRNNSGTVDELGRISTSMSMTQGAMAGTQTHMSRLGTLAIPPISYTLPCIGHSFSQGFQTFIPMVRAFPKGPIQFPPCAPNESVYQTLQIRNIADTPCFYKTLPDPNSQFRVYPPVGFIESKSFTLIALEFNPKNPGTYDYNVTLYLNHMSNMTLNINLIGVCCDPTIIIDNDAKIFYPPLFTGVSSKQKIGILNSSHIPIDYDITIPDKYREELAVDPKYGTMYPHERINVEFKFTALQEMDYRFNVPIRVKRVVDIVQDGNYVGYFNPGSGRMMHNLKQDELEKQYYVTIYGSGGKGRIDLNPKEIEFETVSVGFTAVKSFTLSNVSTCAIDVRLIIVPKNEADYKDQFQMDVINQSFSFDFTSGVLAANSNQKVNLRFVPFCRSQNEYYVQVIARQSFPNSAVVDVPLKHQAQILLKAHGDFPVITIQDLRCKNLSPAKLWKQFDLTSTINSILSPLSPLEIKFNNAEIAQTQAQEKLNRFEWNFGKLLYNPKGEPRRIVLTLKNIGGVIASFKFVLPSDNELEMEGWADPGDPTPEEAFEKHILEQRIFTIAPREAKLECKDLFDVELFYNPIEVGEHYLNILFQIIHGKPIVLTLKGETLPPKRGFLELRSNIFEFHPLPLGLRVGINQPIEMRNLADAKITYHVDMQTLEAYTQQNYNFPIFEVQNPEEIVEPQDTVYLYVMFKPLESKQYQVQVPIIVKERGNYLQTLHLTLKGTGYHPSYNEIPRPLSIFDTLPTSRASFLPKSSLCGFSLEEIDFGETVFGQPVHRMVVLYNRSSNLEYRFTFKTTKLVCGDELVLDPISGTVPPQSYIPVKLALTVMRIPTIYEGELECVVEWENQIKNSKTPDRTPRRPGEAKAEANFVGGTVENLYLRIRKTASLEMNHQGMEIVNNETSIFKNIIRETIQDILTDESFGEILDFFDKEPAPVINQLDNDWPAEMHILFDNSDLAEEESDPDLTKENIILNQEFQDMAKYILEGTVFNVMCEGIYQEMDLVAQSRAVRKYRSK